MLIPGNRDLVSRTHETNLWGLMMAMGCCFGGVQGLGGPWVEGHGGTLHGCMSPARI